MPLSRSDALGKAIRKVRVERELTQEDASIESGMDRAYLGHIERATKSPTVRTVWKIADMLDIKLSELIALAEQLEEESRAK